MRRPWIYWEDTPVIKFFPTIAPQRGDIVLVGARVNEPGGERMRVTRVDVKRKRIKAKPA